MSNCGCFPPIIFGASVPSSPGDCVCNPAIDPAVCNALTETPAGLLVPRTVLAGVAGAAPAATGTDRSVDVDVVETPGCPDQWQVGARLTPPSGFINFEAGHVNLLPTPGTAVPVTASDVVLPEVGTYHIDTDVRYALGTDTGGSGYIVGHLLDLTAGTPLTSFTQIASINAGAPSPGQEHQGSTTHIMAEYEIATAPRTIQLQLMLVVTGGTLSTAEAGGTDSNGASRTRWLKIRD